MCECKNKNVSVDMRGYPKVMNLEIVIQCLTKFNDKGIYVCTYLYMRICVYMWECEWDCMCENMNENAYVKVCICVWVIVNVSMCIWM